MKTTHGSFSDVLNALRTGLRHHGIRKTARDTHTSERAVRNFVNGRSDPHVSTAETFRALIGLKLSARAGAHSRLENGRKKNDSRKKLNSRKTHPELNSRSRDRLGTGRSR